jgi:O-acetyl-ADP-ribose deacetylase (regulator of RNase III)/NAD-dependent SIR2 family protein deacetylase
VPSVTTSHEVIRRIAGAQGDFAAWIGAGLSLEAGVKAGRDICEEIKSQLVATAGAEDPDAWARDNLDWDDPTRRYGKCLSKMGNAAYRIRYFRDIIRGIEPSFSHHAVALLMQRGYFRRSCLTTNFDKLLEMAFAQQGVSEFQAIRSDDETQYWGEEDKYYIIKLHGDYDTANILNTKDEAIRIPDDIRRISTDVLLRSGLVVLGSSGYEQSVTSYFDDLWRIKDRNILRYGVYWGIYMGENRPLGFRAEDELTELHSKIASGAVSKNIVESADRWARIGRNFDFFPMWGAAQFLFDLIGGNAEIAAVARRYLDHRMRLRDVLGRGGLQSDAIEARLRRLEERAQRYRRATAHVTGKPMRALHARKVGTGHRLEVIYGDLADRSLLTLDGNGGRRAVVSPDDIFLSAGGGAALTLLETAGKAPLLSELAKFQAVAQHEVVVTSAFNLPVNYIFHAATVALEPDGTSDTSVEDIRGTLLSALRAAHALSLQMMFVPLIGAGTEAVPPEESFAAIIDTFADFIREMPMYQLGLAVVIRQEAELSRNDAERVLQLHLPEFELTRIPISPK